MTEKASKIVAKEYIHDSLAHVYSDLVYIHDILLDDFENSSTTKNSMLLKNLVSFSSRKAIYDQIRYLDAEGEEIIRINNTPQGGVIVEENLLQNKAHRYYFTNSINLEKGNIYISPMDLNMENKRLEVPYKPMLRFALPLIGSEDKRYGIIIFNYLANDLLVNLPKHHSQNSYCCRVLLNEEGFWLYSSVNHRLPFRFMFPEMEQITFLDHYPQAGKTIYSVDEGVVVTDRGIFIWNTIYPEQVTTEFSREPLSESSSDNTEYFWKNINMMDRSYLKEIRKGSYENTFRFLPLIVLGILLISLLINYLVSKNYHYKEHIEHLAHYDSLTGINNRVFFLDLAKKTLEISSRKKERSAVLFLDLDGFKPINDNYGHETGDYVLKIVAQRLSNRLRQSDLLGRFGGDEFVILLFDVKSKENLKEVLSQIERELEKDIESQSGHVQISGSIGYALFPENGESVEELIDYADRDMFKKKHMRKGS